METTKTVNPHGWFYRHLSQVCDSFDMDEAKKDLVRRYSYGKTDSLAIMYAKYPALYYKMKRALSPVERNNNELDISRKRLIAAIFSHLKDKGYTPDMDYVKRVACNAAKVTRFNEIPLNSLKSLYNQFKNKDLQAGVNELIKNAGVCLSKK